MVRVVRKKRSRVAMVRIKAGVLEEVQTFCCERGGLWQRLGAWPAAALPAARCRVSVWAAEGKPEKS